MLGLDDHDDPLGPEVGHEGVGDLGGDLFLHLRAAGEDLDEAAELAQPGDLAALGRDVADVRDPVEGQQVVLHVEYIGMSRTMMSSSWSIEKVVDSTSAGSWLRPA